MTQLELEMSASVKVRHHWNFHSANHQSTKRLQRHVGVQRKLGSLLSGGSLIFAVADLF
jgi:hypothetical protein